jgi:Flp pilus assembly protein TadB
MADRELPDDVHPPRHTGLRWLALLTGAVFVVRIGLGAVAHVIDVAASVLVLGVIVAVGWHWSVGARRRRDRS